MVHLLLFSNCSSLLTIFLSLFHFYFSEYIEFFQTGKTRTIRQFHFMEWPDRGVPHTAERFVDYVREVIRRKREKDASEAAVDLGGV